MGHSPLPDPRTPPPAPLGAFGTSVRGPVQTKILPTPLISCDFTTITLGDYGMEATLQTEFATDTLVSDSYHNHILHL